MRGGPRRGPRLRPSGRARQLRAIADILGPKLAAQGRIISRAAGQLHDVTRRLRDLAREVKGLKDRIRAMEPDVPQQLRDQLRELQNRLRGLDVDRQRLRDEILREEGLRDRLERELREAVEELDRLGE